MKHEEKEQVQEIERGHLNIPLHHSFIVNTESIFPPKSVCKHKQHKRHPISLYLLIAESGH